MYIYAIEHMGLVENRLEVEKRVTKNGGVLSGWIYPIQLGHQQLLAATYIPTYLYPISVLLIMTSSPVCSK